MTVSNSTKPPSQKTLDEIGIEHTQDLIQSDLLLNTMTTKISTYATVADSQSLKKIDGKSFTIIAVEDSDYEDDGVTHKGVKITTKEKFDLEGEKVSKFHTTRFAVVSKLGSSALREDLTKGIEIGPMNCQLVKSKQGGKDYFDLVDPTK